jgi:beta-1,4-mannosyl-glycoprotein beta-1,4-N-acetylglucosaminyltransferase
MDFLCKLCYVIFKRIKIIAIANNRGILLMKVYDCFTFFNEFELLELRLNLLNNMVDYFVLVEANKTFKNKSKEFYFENNKDRFAKYLHKIIHIKVDDMPDCDLNDPKDKWKSQYYQRDCIARGLQNIDPEDIVLISDIDEIPNPNIIELLNHNKCSVIFKTRNRVQLDLIQVLKLFPQSMFKNHGMRLLDRTPLALEHTLFWYFVNCRSKGKWAGTIITKAKCLSTPQKLRKRREKYPRIQYNGWHFSYLGGVDRILLKINSITEPKANAYSADHIKKCITNGINIYGRKGEEYEYEFINFADISPEQMKVLVQKYPYLYFDYKGKEDDMESPA